MRTVDLTIRIGGAVVCDTALKVDAKDLTVHAVQCIGLPLSEVAEEKAGTSLARNTLSLGVAAGLTGFDLSALQSVVGDNSARKGQEVVDGNLAAVEWGYQQGEKHAGDYPFEAPGNTDAPQRMVLDGTAAFPWARWLGAAALRRATR